MISKEMLNEIDVDDILEALGLERRGFTGVASLVPAISMFAIGAVVGAAVGMAFAPRPGSEMRQDLGRRVDEIKKKIGTNGQQKGTARSRGSSAQPS
jgi:hypothetical protein